MAWARSTARDIKLGRIVAIKVLPEAVAADAQRIARHDSEARALATLNHPHIATTFGTDESYGRYFLVMEFIDGETLARPSRAPATRADADAADVPGVVLIGDNSRASN